jgi:hypothetical protein
VKQQLTTRKRILKFANDCFKKCNRKKEKAEKRKKERAKKKEELRSSHQIKRIEEIASNPPAACLPP